jgi:acetyl esterase/lipase
MIRKLIYLIASGVILVAAHGAESVESTHPWDIRKDIQYAEVEGHALLLDLYLPHGTRQPPLIVWVHGGAWRSGDKSSMPLQALLRDGFTVASVEYRLTTIARFPAQVHDLKAAIRFLRAKASEWKLNPERIAIAGASAGGHLAALVGVSNGNSLLEGKVGNYLDQSSDVQAIVSFFGASNLQTILDQSTPHGLGVRIPALQLLLGGQPEEKVELARLASPVAHVDAHDPPLLLLHGDQDPQMPINQSHELQGLYRALGLPVQFEVVHGGAHGGKKFFDEPQLKLVSRFLELAASSR